jgi:hypothetical protein
LLNSVGVGACCIPSRYALLHLLQHRQLTLFGSDSENRAFMLWPTVLDIFDKITLKVLEEKEPRAFVKFRIILETSLSLKHIRRSTSKLIHRQLHHQNTLEDIHASLSATQPHHLVTLQPHGIIRQARTSQAHSNHMCSSVTRAPQPNTLVVGHIHLLNTCVHQPMTCAHHSRTLS